MSEYLRGLQAAYAVAVAKPAAHAFMAAAEIMELIDTERARLKPIEERVRQHKAALNPNRFGGAS